MRARLRIGAALCAHRERPRRTPARWYEGWDYEDYNDFGFIMHEGWKD